MFGYQNLKLEGTSAFFRKFVELSSRYPQEDIVNFYSCLGDDYFNPEWNEIVNLKYEKDFHTN